jgi:thioesterase domain-containing protein
MDGRRNGEPDEITVKDMAHGYVEEILNTNPGGPIIVAGMCAGALAALEVARELKARGKKLGPVILADPPGVPQGLVRQNQLVDSRDPLVASQLYRRVQGQLLDHASQSYNDVPFAIDDSQQLHAATLAGMSALVAFCRHIPEAYPGHATAILSSRRAANFFHPQMHWVNLLQNCQAHVLSYDHTEIFRSGRYQFIRILKFILDGAADLETGNESTIGGRFRPTEEFTHEFG